MEVVCEQVRAEEAAEAEEVPEAAEAPEPPAPKSKGRPKGAPNKPKPKLEEPPPAPAKAKAKARPRAPEPAPTPEPFEPTFEELLGHMGRALAQQRATRAQQRAALYSQFIS